MATGWTCDQGHSMFAVSIQDLQSCSACSADILAASVCLSCMEMSCTDFVCQSCQVQVQMQTNPSEADQSEQMQDTPSQAGQSMHILVRSPSRLPSRAHQFKQMSCIRSVFEIYALQVAQDKQVSEAQRLRERLESIKFALSPALRASSLQVSPVHDTYAAQV